MPVMQYGQNQQCLDRTQCRTLERLDNHGFTDPLLPLLPLKIIQSQLLRVLQCDRDNSLHYEAMAGRVVSDLRMLKYVDEGRLVQDR